MRPKAPRRRKIDFLGQKSSIFRTYPRACEMTRPASRCLGAHPAAHLAATGPRAAKWSKWPFSNLFKRKDLEQLATASLASKMRPRRIKVSSGKTKSN